jgi:hypothetical protein
MRSWRYSKYMAFVRSKQIGGTLYHYLAEGVRRDGKVKQVVIAYLGPHSTVEAA